MEKNQQYLLVHQDELKEVITIALKEVFDLATTRSSNEKEILRPKEVQKILGCSRSHLDKLSNQDPDFPKVIRFGSRWTGYRKADVDNYIKNLESSTRH